MLQIMLWWIAPLAILLIKRKSKFVSFHALQALLLQAAYVLTLIAGLILALGLCVIASVLSPERGNGLPPEFYFLMPVFWLSWMGMGLVVLLGAIVYGVKAGRGEWAEYRYLGPLARKILKLGPGGVELSVVLEAGW